LFEKFFYQIAKNIKKKDFIFYSQQAPNDFLCLSKRRNFLSLTNSSIERGAVDHFE